MLSDTETGALRLHKRLTTAEDPAIGAREGLRQILSDHGASTAQAPATYGPYGVRKV